MLLLSLPLPLILLHYAAMGEQRVGLVHLDEEHSVARRAVLTASQGRDAFLGSSLRFDSALHAMKPPRPEDTAQQWRHQRKSRLHSETPWRRRVKQCQGHKDTGPGVRHVSDTGPTLPAGIPCL